MYATLLTMALLGQWYPVDACSPGYVPNQPRLPSRWMWFYVPQSPWNQSVNNLRAAMAEQPKAVPNVVEWMSLEALREAKEDAYDELVAAPRREKDELRSEYMRLREQLHDERLQVVRDMHRRRRNGTAY